MKKYKFKNAITELKVRGEKKVIKIEQILENFEKQDQTYLAGSLIKVEALRVTGSQIGETIPLLGQEGGEALDATAFLDSVMKESGNSLISVLDLVNYRYGRGSGTVFEFFNPPNQRAFGYSPKKRLVCHKVVDEGHEKYSEDFGPDDAERFVTARQVEEKLVEANENFKKETKEGKAVVKNMLKLLATSRKQISALRNTLKGELDNPDDVYNIIPRRSKKS